MLPSMTSACININIHDPNLWKDVLDESSASNARLRDIIDLRGTKELAVPNHFHGSRASEPG